MPALLRSIIKPYLLLIILFILSNNHIKAETLPVPIPIIRTDPNEGRTLGALLALVEEDEGRLKQILVPFVTYNPYYGYMANFNVLGYPSEKTEYFIDLSHSTENFFEYQFRYLERDMWDWSFPLSLKLDFAATRDPTYRFYGIGPDSKKEDESSYTSTEIRMLCNFIFSLGSNLYFSLGTRLRHPWIQDGEIEDTYSLLDRYPDLPSVHGSFVMAHSVSLEYDSRNSDVTPTSGIYGKIFVEAAQSDLLENTFLRSGIKGLALIPLFDERSVTVLRGELEFLYGDKIPFFELNKLGGNDSLRGFGGGRFHDKNKVLFSIEERIKVFNINVGKVQLDIEFALFVDIGQVFGSSLKWQDHQFVYGNGVRLVVRDNIVARIDVGFGGEGMAVFSGLNYPF